MKKLLLLFLLSIFADSYSQNNDTLFFDGYKDFTNSLYSDYKAKYPSLSFFRYKLIAPPPNIFDSHRGETTDSSLSAITYLQLVNDLDIANCNNHPMINLLYIEGEMIRRSMSGTIPLSFALVEYEDYKDSTLALYPYTFTNNKFQENSPPGYYPFKKQVLFAGSALSTVFDSPEITFSFSDSLLLTNVNTSAIENRYVDFDDGNGFVPLETGIRTITYLTSGEKTIRFKATYKGEEYISSSKIQISETVNAGLQQQMSTSAAACDKTVKLPDVGPVAITTTKLGTHVSGEYGVWFSPCNTTGHIRKPYIICAGFNPGNGKQLVSNGFSNAVNFLLNNTTVNLPNGGWQGDWRGTYYETYNGMYNKRFSPDEVDQCTTPILDEGESSNGSYYLDRLRDEGYDIIILKFDNGTDHTINNAALLIELIEFVNINKLQSGHSFENVVSGYSQGGLASRLALALMEYRYKTGLGPHPHTRIWVSYDGEHQGANVPLGIQYFLEFQKNPFHIMPTFANPGQQTADMINQVMATIAYGFNVSPGSNEVCNYMEVANNGMHQDRINLLNQFASIPGNTMNGYPEFCRRVGISQGSGLGFSVPYSQPEILDSRLFKGAHNQQVNSFPSNCLGSYTWYLPHAEKTTKARWWSANNPGSNIFEGRVYLSSLTTIKPRLCVNTAIWGCVCNMEWTIGNVIVFGQKSVPKPTPSSTMPANYDNVPASTQATHVEIAKNSAYAFYNNWLPTLGGGAHFNYDEQLHNFCPTVSTLDLRDPQTGLPVSPTVSPVSMGLMFQQPGLPHPFSRYGFPYINNVNNYQITPFDAVYAIGTNNGIDVGNHPRPNNQFHVEDPQIFISDYLSRTEVAPENLFLSNITFGLNAYTYQGYTNGYKGEFESRKKIIIGATKNDGNNIYDQYGNLDYLTPNGEFKLDSKASLKLHCGEQIDMLPGTSIETGSEFAAYIEPYACANNLFKTNEQKENSLSHNSNEGTAVKSSVDLRRIISNPDFKVFPNPTRGNLSIISPAEIPNAEVEILDLMGKQVFTGFISDGTADINLSLNNGIYVIVIRSSQFVQKSKLIISH